MIKMKDTNAVRNRLDQNELLTQLAEEAAELSQAALKLRRANMNINPTTKSVEEAYNNLLEEMADVRVCVKALHLDNIGIDMMLDDIAGKKMARWAERLKGENNG